MAAVLRQDSDCLGEVAMPSPTLRAPLPSGREAHTLRRLCGIKARNLALFALSALALCGCQADAGHQDIGKALADWALRVINWMDQAVFLFTLRAGIITLFSLLACRHSYEYSLLKHRRVSSVIQWAVFTGAVCVGLWLPLGALYAWLCRSQDVLVLKGFVFIAAIGMTIAGPKVLPRYLVAHSLTQAQLTWVAYRALPILFLVNVIWSVACKLIR
jgi:hypothetical protein